MFYWINFTLNRFNFFNLKFLEKLISGHPFWEKAAIQILFIIEIGLYNRQIIIKKEGSSEPLEKKIPLLYSLIHNFRFMTKNSHLVRMLT